MPASEANFGCGTPRTPTKVAAVLRLARREKRGERDSPDPGASALSASSTGPPRPHTTFRSSKKAASRSNSRAALSCSREEEEEEEEGGRLNGESNRSVGPSVRPSVRPSVCIPCCTMDR